MSTSNPYRDQAVAVLPRVLAMFDRNPVSPCFGQGDRYWWAWKWIDFGNGTMQGIANGLSRLLVHGLLPEWLPEQAAKRRILEMFEGARSLARANGSMEEAFPNESSYCVTALIAYDLLTAVELLGDRLTKAERATCLATVAPMILFLHKAREVHGFISNHLATAAAALCKWTTLTGSKGYERGCEIVRDIMARQSQEGWFLEYEGADPGYQTLCVTYLADLHQRCPELGLGEPLARSMTFIQHFAHPDGSLGGLYGSRNTRFYFPGGVEALAGEFSQAAAFGAYMRDSVAMHRVVTLDTMDPGNLPPMFNSYCWAAAQLADRGETQAYECPEIPCNGSGAWRRHFPEAGLLVDKGDFHYTVVNWRKGGVVSHFRLDDSSSVVDSGVCLRSQRGRLYSSQAWQETGRYILNGDVLEVETPFTLVNLDSPTPGKFLMLRVLCLTVFRSMTLGNLVKKLLVRMLITGKKTSPIRLRRRIRLGADLAVQDELLGDASGFSKMDSRLPFSAIYMASQGYWQRQDDRQ